MDIDRREGLRSRVGRWASAEGYNPSPLAGLLFNRCSKGQNCEKGIVNGVTLWVVMQGRAQVRVHDRTFEVDPFKQLVITGETVLHSTTSMPADGRPFLSLNLTFSPETIVKGLMALAGVGADATAEPVPAFISDMDAGVLDVLLRLVESLDDPVDRQLLGPIAMAECALRLLRSDAAATFRSAIGKDGDLAKIDKAMRFMQANRSRSLSVRDIARHVGMSESSFAHRFREVARTSPMRYLRQTRLDHARVLMLSEGARPSEAAAQVGFESTSHFTREFKRLYGAPPADYARRFGAGAARDGGGEIVVAARDRLARGREVR